MSRTEIRLIIKKQNLIFKTDFMQSKKWDKKQLAYSRKKVLHAKMNILSKVLLVIMVAMAIPCLSFAAQDAANTGDAMTTMMGPMILFTMSVAGDVEDVSDVETAGSRIAYKVWLIDVDDIDDSVPFPKANAARQVGAIPMKAGRYMRYFKAHDIPTDNSTGERGDITTEGTNTFVIVMGGNRDVLLDIIENKAGGKFIIVYQEVDSEDKYIQGTLGRPMILKGYDRKKDKEATAVTFTFENKSLQQPKHYIGGIVNQDPVAVATDATDLAVDGSNLSYMLPNDNTVAKALATVSGIAPADYGSHITLFGQGGANAHTIADNAKYILVDGATWTANAGSRITFKIQDASTLIEVDRVQS